MVLREVIEKCPRRCEKLYSRRTIPLKRAYSFGVIECQKGSQIQINGTRDGFTH